MSCFSSVQLQDLCAAPVRLHPPSPVHSVSLHPSVCLSADSISPSCPTVTSSVTTLFSVIPSTPIHASVPLPCHQDQTFLPAACGWNHSVWHHRHAQLTEGENEKDHGRDIWNQITSEFFLFLHCYLIRFSQTPLTLCYLIRSGQMKTPLSSLFRSIQPYISWIRYRLLQALPCTQTFLHKSTLCWWLEWWTTRQVREQDTLFTIFYIYTNVWGQYNAYVKKLIFYSALNCDKKVTAKILFQINAILLNSFHQIILKKCITVFIKILSSTTVSTLIIIRNVSWA